jgi:hypothetical protein
LAILSFFLIFDIASGGYPISHFCRP